MGERDCKMLRLKGMLEGKEYGIGNSEMQYHGEKGDMEKEGIWEYGKKGNVGINGNWGK